MNPARYSRSQPGKLPRRKEKLDMATLACLVETRLVGYRWLLPSAFKVHILPLLIFQGQRLIKFRHPIDINLG